MSSNYQFRPVDVSDESLADYASLFHLCYARGTAKYTKAYVRWQYCANPSGPVIGFDAWSDGKRVAHYVVLPQRYRRLDGQVIHGAVSLNTVTHPQHQGKGLFTKLAMMTYEEAASRGFEMITGVANQASFPGFIKRLGFVSLGRVDLSIALASRVPVADERQAGMLLSQEFLRWRFCNPSSRYSFKKLAGGRVAVFCKVNGLPFCIASFRRLSGEDMGVACSGRGFDALCLVPSFGLEIPLSITVPKLLLPSPWEFIGRSLTPTPTDETCRGFSIIGLDMDSF